MEVTVNNVTVIITDYKPKKVSLDPPAQNGSSHTPSVSAPESVKSDSDDGSVTVKLETNGVTNHNEDMQ